MTPNARGGCYPPNWPAPPVCWPPLRPPPEPDPDSLDADVDWQSYQHHELHAMVHSGLDLTGAMEVSARWGRVGAQLADIGEELGKVVELCANAWQGEAAELARQTLAGLADWATDTGAQATTVSACVSIEVDNATNARDEMPAPPYPTALAATPDAPPQPQFTSGGFADAATITADPVVSLREEKLLHEQAARTMERFQVASREVYGTVPQFSPPQIGTINVDPAEPPLPPQRQQPQPPQGLVAAPPPRPGASPAPTGAPGARAVSPGPGTSAAEPAAHNRPAAVSAGAQGRGQPGVSGMPMSGAGAGRAEDTERKGPAYLKEDEDVWGVHDRPTVPPVIGEGRRRA